MECCDMSELHPRSGFGMLVRRFVLPPPLHPSYGARPACEADLEHVAA
jgi:hypothetical protein